MHYTRPIIKSRVSGLGSVTICALGFHPRLSTHFIIGTSGEAPVIVKCGTGYFCMSDLMRDCETETKDTCRVTLLGRNKASWWYYEGQQQAKL